jgi:hypothetical protein
MKRPCEAGKWWVSLNGREVFRGHGRGSALSYASSLALVSVFDRKVVSIEVHGPQGVVWRYLEEPDYEGLETVQQPDRGTDGARSLGRLLPAHHLPTDSGGKTTECGVFGCSRPNDLDGTERGSAVPPLTQRGRGGAATLEQYRAAALRRAR